MMISLDKKYKTVRGLEVKLYSVDVDNGGVYPVHGAVLSPSGVWVLNCWKLNGEHNGRGGDLVEVSPYSDLKIDDLVYVWDGNEPKVKRHFAGINEYTGMPMVFDFGTSSWTNFSGVSPWDHCEKADWPIRAL